MVEGLEHGHWALVSKVHHCMVDGVSGTDLLTVVLDSEPEPARADARRVAARSRSRATRGSSRDALVDLVAQPVRAAPRGCVRRRARRARRCSQLGEVARGLRAWTGVVRPTPPSSLNGPIGPHRRWDWARTTLADVKTVRDGARRHGQRRRAHRARRAASATCCSRATRASTDRVVRTLVPVSVRTPGERGTYNNRVSAMIAELPVGHRRSRRAARGDPRADGRAQGVEAGGRRRGAHLAVGFRAVVAARARARASRCGSRSATSTP